jgi:preprotein translocase subunit YajC
MDQLSNGLVLLQAAPAAGGNSTMQMLSTLVTFGLVFVIFYFLIIRPQNKKQKDAQKMIAAVKKGDRVVTIGGVHAVVSSVKEKTVILKVDENTKMEFSKSAIASVEPKEAEEKADAAEKPAASEKIAAPEKPAEEKK